MAHLPFGLCTGSLPQPSCLHALSISHAALQMVEVATGSYGSFALTEEGHVWAWGLNQYGQLGIPGEVSNFAHQWGLFCCMPKQSGVGRLRVLFSLCMS